MNFIKTAFLILIALSISLNTFSQEDAAKPIKENKNKRTLLQRIIVDLGATPYQYNNDWGYTQSFNFALGYEFNRLDVRFNFDIHSLTYGSRADEWISDPRQRYLESTSFTFGLGYSIFNDFKFINYNTDIDLQAKIGNDKDEYGFLNALVFDMFIRSKFNNLAYLGIGVNYHSSELSGGSYTGFYAKFGIEI